MRVIDFTLSFDLVREYAKLWNKKNEIPELALHEQPLETMRSIIRLYVKTLKGQQKLLKPGEPLPPLFTNNPTLAKFRGLTTRTIRRHRRLLTSAGFLSNYKFHGSGNDFEFQISPKLLFVGLQVDGEALDRQIAHFEANEPDPIIDALRTKCPDTDSLFLFNKIMGVENTVKAVPTDSLPPGNESEVTFKATNDRNTEDPAPNIADEKIETGTGGAPDETGDLGRGVEIFSAPSLALIRDNAEMLWLSAATLLYDEIVLTDSQIHFGKRALLWILMNKCTNDVQIETRYRMLKEMILLVCRWKNKPLKPGELPRFIPIPTKYFDPENLKGFRGAYNWYKINEARKWDIHCESELKKAIDTFHKNEALATDHKDKKDRTRMYSHCERRVMKLNKPEFMALFYKAIANPQPFRNINLKKLRNGKTPLENKNR